MSLWNRTSVVAETNKQKKTFCVWFVRITNASDLKDGESKFQPVPKLSRAFHMECNAVNFICSILSAIPN